MAQLVASMSYVVLGGVVEVVGSNLVRDKISNVVLGGVVEVVGSNLVRGKIFDSIYPSVYIENYNLTPIYIYIFSNNIVFFV